MLLKAWGDGDPAAVDRLVPAVHSELRRIAHNYVRREGVPDDLHTTLMVNETVVRLLENPPPCNDREHFFLLTARVMRQILVDRARARHCVRRGAGVDHAEFGDEIAAPEACRELIALNDALNALAVDHPRKCRVIELRFFGGYSVQEAAEALGISADTVSRDFNFARAWLKRELRASS